MGNPQRREALRGGQVGFTGEADHEVQIEGNKDLQVGLEATAHGRQPGELRNPVVVRAADETVGDAHFQECLRGRRDQ